MIGSRRRGPCAPCVLFAAALAACGGTKREPDRTTVRVLAASLGADVTTFARMGVVEFLTRAPHDYGPTTPFLARSWQDLGDGRWRFDLVADVRFHDGGTLDSAAVADAVRAFLATPTGALLRPLLRVEPQGPLTVDVVSSAAALPVAPTLGRIPIVRPSSYDAAGRLRSPVGTGPFRVDSLRIHDEAVLMANPAYWRGAPALATVRVREVRDQQTRVRMLEAGDADWAQVIPRNDFRRLADAGWRIGRFRFVYDVFVAFNTRRSPGSDLAFRRACAFAIDRAEIARAAYDGTVPVAWTFFPPESGLNPDDIETYGFDPERARRILDEAGWRLGPDGKHRERGGERLALTLAAGDERFKPGWTAAAEIVARSLEAVGVECALRVEEENTWDTRILALDYQATIRGRGPLLWPDPLGVLRNDFHSAGPDNAGRIVDPELDAWIDGARASSDPALRRDLLQKSLRRIADRVAVVPLVHDVSQHTYAVDPRLEGADDEDASLTGFPGHRTRWAQPAKP